VTVVRVPRGPRTERSFPPTLAGRAEVVSLESSVLRDNPLGDAVARDIAVLKPPSGRSEGGPLVVFLPGFLGAGPAELRRGGPFDENLFQLFDRLMRSGASPEATVVSPDCRTSLGGTQYVNSSAVGRYDDFVIRELLPWARERYGTREVGLLGQSSGGFGALHLALEHPGVCAAVGSSAGDVGFEYAYLPDLASAVRQYQRHGGPSAFLAHLFEDPTLLKGPTHPSGAALFIAATGASYSPIDAEPGAFELPIDWESSEFVPRVWARWKAFDPVARAASPEGAAALRRLRLLHLAASDADEWSLDQGARWLAAVARRQGVRVVHDELVGGHFDRSPRFTALFPSLVQSLREGSS